MNETQYIGIKKYGFFDDQVSTFDQVAGELGLPKAEVNDPNGRMIGHWWRRHPLAFLMEAADDICYNVMDLEDAYLSGDVDFNSVISLLEKLIPRSNKAYLEQGAAETVLNRPGFAGGSNS